MKESNTYLTTEELSARLKYDCKDIRQQLKDSALIGGKYYIKPFGRRKILFTGKRLRTKFLMGRALIL